MPGNMTKREIERLIFQIFLGTSPSYPQCFGNELFSVDQPDHDPPDVLCVSRAGRTLGVELREWLVQGQIAGGKKRERAEDSVRQALLPEPPNIYPHVGHIWLYPRESAPLPSSARGAFRSEILTLIAQIEQSWPKLEWWDQSGRFGVTNFADYGSFQTLPHHLHGLDVFWIGPGHRKREIHWLTFRASGGDYSPDWMVDALCEGIEEKVQKYSAKPPACRMDEFHLLLYYDQAVVYNTPVHGFPQAAQAARLRLQGRAIPFTEIHLLNATGTPEAWRIL
jgi:hypothetical protein